MINRFDFPGTRDERTVKFSCSSSVLVLGFFFSFVFCSVLCSRVEIVFKICSVLCSGVKKVFVFCYILCSSLIF